MKPPTNPNGREIDLAIARDIVRRQLAPGLATACVFGSTARGDALRYSDLDIGILPRQPLPPGTLAALREALAESSMLIDADVVDLSEADEEFRSAVLREARTWIE